MSDDADDRLMVKIEFARPLSENEREIMEVYGFSVVARGRI
jgi:hypothetical protein